MEESDWQTVAIEVHGPFEVTASGNQHVVTATDQQTKWIEAEALKESTAQEVAKFLLNTFARLGFCKYQFVNCAADFFVEITEEVKTQGEGLLSEDQQWERLLSVLPESDAGYSDDVTEYLKQQIVAEGLDWDKKLCKILFSIRSSGVTGTSFGTPIMSVRPQKSAAAVNGHQPPSPKPRKRKSGRPKKLDLREVVFDEQDQQDTGRKVTTRRAAAAKRQPYGLRMTLKAKGKSSVVSRMLSKSRLKRALESGDDVTEDVNVQKPAAAKPKAGRGKAKTEIKSEKSKLSEEEGEEEQEEEDEEEDDSPEEEEEEEDGEQTNSSDPLFFVSTADENAKKARQKSKRSKKEPPPEKKEKTARKRHSLSEEQMEEIKGWDPMTCPQCPDVGFVSRRELDLHIAFHREGSPTLVCVHCEQQEEDWAKMQLHLTAHDDVPISLTLPIECFTCKECQKVLETIDDVERHLQAYHRHRAVSTCKTCGMQFRSHRRHVAHLGVHDGVQFQCTKCRFHTKTFCALAEHQVVHQGSGVQCTSCSKVFPSIFHMKDHQKVHKRMEDLNICEFCGKLIYGTGAMRHHIRYFHSDAEQFPCPLCTYVGRTKSNLRGHTDRIHKKPFKCTHCDYACLAERTLQKHVDMFHNPSDRHFPCLLCPYRGRDSKTLAEHFRIRHKSSEGFCCPTCQVVFKTRTLLRDHMPTHTGARAYLCKLCDYTAKYRPTMYRHVMNKHPGYTLSTAVNVSGRESTARVSSGNRGTGRSKGPKSTMAIAKIEEMQKVETVEVPITREFVFEEREEVELTASAVEDGDAVGNIPDGNMVAIMDANLLAEMAASGQVCVQYIDAVGNSVETVEVGTLRAESADDVKEKYQMLATGLTFSCL